MGKVSSAVDLVKVTDFSKRDYPIYISHRLEYTTEPGKLTPMAIFHVKDISSYSLDSPDAASRGDETVAFVVNALRDLGAQQSKVVKHSITYEVYIGEYSQLLGVGKADAYEIIAMPTPERANSLRKELLTRRPDLCDSTVVYRSKQGIILRIVIAKPSKKLTELYLKAIADACPPGPPGPSSAGPGGPGEPGATPLAVPLAPQPPQQQILQQPQPFQQPQAPRLQQTTQEEAGQILRLFEKLSEQVKKSGEEVRAEMEKLEKEINNSKNELMDVLNQIMTSLSSINELKAEIERLKAVIRELRAEIERLGGSRSTPVLA